MPGVNVEPSSLTQECFTAVGSKKIAADVSDASISCEAMENIMAMIWLETSRIHVE
jgi:catabolite regulation protein CreA